MINTKNRVGEAVDILAIVDEINQLTVIGGVSEMLASNPVILEQITIANLCRNQLEEDDDFLMDELQAILAKLRVVAAC